MPKIKKKCSFCEEEFELNKMFDLSEEDNEFYVCLDCHNTLSFL